LRFFFGDQCFFGLCPVGGGHTYGFGHVAEPHFHDDVHGRLARLRRRFDGFAEPVQEYLAALERDEQVHCSTVEWVDQEEWHRGRVVLIGDAAHASSPMMGQGGGMAVEDAYVLTECLRSAETVEVALDRYGLQAKAAGELGAAGKPFGVANHRLAHPSLGMPLCGHAVKKCLGIDSSRLLPRHSDIEDSASVNNSIAPVFGTMWTCQHWRVTCLNLARS
jgi:hypothetical protein